MDNKTYIVTIIGLVLLLGGIIGYDYVRDQNNNIQDEIVDVPHDVEDEPIQEETDHQETEVPNDTIKPEETKKPADRPNNGNTETKPEHIHKYDVLVLEKSHMEEKEVPYTIEVPVYETVKWFECDKCQAKFDDEADCDYHCSNVCESTYTPKEEKTQTGTKQEIQYKKEQFKVIDEPEHYECSCGVRKP